MPMPLLDPSYINLEATAAALDVLSEYSEGMTAPSVDSRVNAFYDCEVPIAVFALVLQLATDGYVEAGPRQPDKYERFFLTKKGIELLKNLKVPPQKSHKNSRENQLQRLKNKSDQDIDFSDIPELDDT